MAKTTSSRPEAQAIRDDIVCAVGMVVGDVLLGAERVQKHLRQAPEVRAALQRDGAVWRQRVDPKVVVVATCRQPQPR